MAHIVKKLFFKKVIFKTTSLNANEGHMFYLVEFIICTNVDQVSKKQILNLRVIFFNFFLVEYTG